MAHSKSLLSFGNEIEFKKSSNSIQNNQAKIKNRLYDFNNCIYGDKVYYDKDLGYNLISGEYIGFCCVEKGQIDDKPRFVYKEDIGKMTWNEAIEKCQEIPNGYLPNKDELKLAYNNSLKNELLQYNCYWSSTQYDSNRAYSIYTYDGCVTYDYKDNDNLVRLFFHIPQIENQVNESFNFNSALLNLGNDDLHFTKSDNSIKASRQKINNAFYDFKSCLYGDKLYYDKTYGYNLLSGEYMGFCCIPAGQLTEFGHDDNPRFAYKSDYDDNQYIQEHAVILCKKIKNGYLPSIDELMVAGRNGLSDELHQQEYWSNTEEDIDEYHVYYVKNKSSRTYNIKEDTCFAIRPFIDVYKSVNDAFDFNTALLDLNDDDSIEFSKSGNSLKANKDSIKNQMYDFKNCRVGDEIYKDDTYGINLYTGDLFGYCVIDANVIDENPRFVYKQSIGISEWRRKAAIKMATDFGKPCQFYLPTIKEAEELLKNIRKNNFINLDEYTTYWTAKESDRMRTWRFSKKYGLHMLRKDQKIRVLPFFNPTQPVMNESFNFNTALLNLDDDDDNISFNKSNVTKVANNTAEKAKKIMRLSSTDIKRVISKFTGLYNLPGSVNQVKQEDELDQQQLYMNINNAYIESTVDSLLLAKGWIGISGNEYYLLDYNDKKVQIINKALNENPEIEEQVNKNINSGSIGFYLSPDYGVIGIYHIGHYFRFMLTDNVVYPDCMSEDPHKSEIQEFQKNCLKPLVSKKVYDSDLSNYVVSFTADNIPYIDFQYVQRSSKFPSFFQQLMTEFITSKNCESVNDDQIKSVFNYDSFKEKYMFNGEQICDQLISKKGNVFIQFSKIHDNIQLNRYILRIAPLNLV